MPRLYLAGAFVFEVVESGFPALKGVVLILICAVFETHRAAAHLHVLQENCPQRTVLLVQRHAVVA